MAVAINTYSGILGGVLSWLGRDASGETASLKERATDSRISRSSSVIVGTS